MPGSEGGAEEAGASGTTTTMTRIRNDIRCLANEFYLHHPRGSPGRDGEGLGLFREAALRDVRACSSPGTGGHDAPSEASDTIDKGKAEIQDLMIVMLINGAKVLRSLADRHLECHTVLCRKRASDSHVRRQVERQGEGHPVDDMRESFEKK